MCMLTNGSCRYTFSLTVIVPSFHDESSFHKSTTNCDAQLAESNIKHVQAIADKTSETKAVRVLFVITYSGIIIKTFSDSRGNNIGYERKNAVCMLYRRASGKTGDHDEAAL